MSTESHPTYLSTPRRALRGRPGKHVVTRSLACAAIALLVVSGGGRSHAATLKFEFESQLATLTTQFSMASAELSNLQTNYTAALTEYAGHPSTLAQLQSLNPSLVNLQGSGLALQTSLVATHSTLAPLFDPIDPVVITQLDGQIAVLSVQTNMFASGVGSLHFQYDAIMATVPEPASYVLGSLAVLGLLVARRRCGKMRA